MNLMNVAAWRWIGRIIAIVIASALAAGCSSGGGGASALTSVGSYQSPPPGIAKVRVGVTELKVEGGADDPLAAVGSLGEFAGDEVATLLAKSGRFDVVGRVALEQSLDQQGLSDVIKPGTLVRPAAINGVEYVLVGTLSNLSIAKRPATPGVMGKMKSWVKQSTQNKQVQVIANCNVALKLIDPKTGDVMLSNNSQFSRTGGATEMGIDVLDAAASQSGELPVSEEDQEQVVRLALDDAVRKSLPKIDRFLQSRGGLQQGVAAASPTTQPAPKPGTATPPAPTATPSAPAAAPSAMKICPSCGAANDLAAKFCRKCGGNL